MKSRLFPFAGSKIESKPFPEKGEGQGRRLKGMISIDITRQNMHSNRKINSFNSKKELTLNLIIIIKVKNMLQKRQL